MRRILFIALALGSLTSVLGGCGDEDPTEVGAGLIGQSVRTFEVFLDGSDFLVSDTTYDRLGSLNRAPFWLVADDYAGELDARTLFSVVRPFDVTWQDSTVTRTDSVVAIVGGTLTLVVDSLASTTGPVELEVYEVTEDWDWFTTSWDLRTDTADVSEPWTTPGGTLGTRLATATWGAGDTLKIPLDSQAVAIWQDTVAARRGGLVRAVTPGSRLVLQSVLFQFDVVPDEAPDTVVQGGSIRSRVSLATPDTTTPGAEALRVGGLPAWRSLLRFQPLADKQVGCGPASPPTCAVSLADVTINLATLVLEPLPVGGRRIERPVWLETRAVLTGPEGVPLTRSPLSGLLGFMNDSLTADLFDGTTADLDPIQVPATNFVRRLVSPPEGQDPWVWMALTSANEFTEFGYTAFGSLASPWAPRLRLVVSVPEEELTP